MAVTVPPTISIHALLAESDDTGHNFGRGNTIFLSTLSLRRATIISQHSTPNNGNFYPRSPCGERLREPREAIETLHFYPRSPCGERLNKRCKFSWDNRFLSTLSLRRATHHNYNRNPYKLFLSTLSLRRATQTRADGPGSCPISIHALLAESDFIQNDNISVWAHFYPRSPCGERPGGQRPAGPDRQDFYPRSPCGERPTRTPDLTTIGQFLSTLSLRRATWLTSFPSSPTRISIHALLAESDRFTVSAHCFQGRFLSTLSLRRATSGHETTPYRVVISIHALLAESDHDSYVVMEATKIISIHALLAESDHDSYVVMEATKIISIHALLAESDGNIGLAVTVPPTISIHALLAESDR